MPLPFRHRLLQATRPCLRPALLLFRVPEAEEGCQAEGDHRQTESEVRYVSYGYIL